MTGSLSSEISPSVVAEREAYLLDFCRLARAEWPGNRALTVVCHGHSVPAGYFKSPDVQTFNSYPHLTHVGLKRQFPFAVFNVIVTAIGGEDSRAGAERFDREVIPLKPDIVTIDYGLNDRRIGLHHAREAWKAMIEPALRKGIKIILLTPTPDVESRFSSGDDPLYQHAEQIRALAAEYHIGLADSLAAFSEAISAGRNLSGLMSQSNHPNREGHELVVSRLMQWFPDTTNEHASA